MKYLVLAIGLLLVVSNLADGLSLRERLAQQKNETKVEGSSDDATTTIEAPKGPTLLLKEVDFAETNCTGNVCNTTQDTCECTGVCEYVFSQNPCFCKRDWHCHDTSIVNRTSRAANSTIAKPVVSPNVGPASSAEDSDDDADHDDDTDEDNSGEDGPTTRIRRDTTDSERDARRKDNVPINCAIQSCSPHQQNPNATTDSHNSSHGKPDHGKHNSTTDSPNSSHGKHNSTNGSHTNGARDQPIATPPSPQGSRARRGADDSKPALDQRASNTRQNSTTIRPALQQDAKNNSQSKVTSQGPRTTLGGADAKQDSPAPQPARASSQDDDDDDDDDTPVATKTTRTRRGAPLATQGSNKNVTSPKPTPQPTHPPTTPKTTRSRRGAPLLRRVQTRM
ncbi:uncharacterized protein [Macrobrachium rosenbergii]|uniref:uncharacterized protein n=1 Tax=Macrobrachium rosenbergii TaxID=79674 RepID=UPI0034D75AB2